MESITSLKPARFERFSLLRKYFITTGKSLYKTLILQTHLIRQKIIILKENNFPAVPVIWFGTSTLLAFIALGLLFSFSLSANGPFTRRYSIFSSKPLVLGISTSSILGKDSRAATLNQVFAEYGCPMEGLGDTFVEEADKNKIPYWIVPAISFQESGCGHKTPEVEGQETYNAWGWGVWGDNIKGFSNWEDGIKTVSEYLGKNFYAKKVTDPCVIMKTYTPPSEGSWCEGVNYFKDVITHYKSS